MDGGAEHYYLFGAGINAYAVIQFFGKENILGAIDNDVRKQGGEIEGIPIISLQEYVSQKDKKTVIITGYYNSDMMIRDLEKNGIYDYYVCPYMQNGFYKDSQDLIQKLELNDYRELAFCTQNPISAGMERELRRHRPDLRIIYMDRDHAEESAHNIPVIITNNVDRQKIEELEKTREFGIKLDINDIFARKYAFRNEKIKTIRNIHQGKRCFIIGNGPSLKYEDLEKLRAHGEICFGLNRIYKAYPYTQWRPNYYVVVDYMILKLDHAKIRELEGAKFIRHSYKFVEKWDEKEIYEFNGLAYFPGRPQISFDMYQGVYLGNTVAYDAMQIALYMGFEEIYLLGVDMTSGVRPEDEGAHFYNVSDKQETIGIGNVALARKCWAYAAEEIEKTGRKLRNATRRGELEEVKRVDFDALF